MHEFKFKHKYYLFESFLETFVLPKMKDTLFSSPKSHAQLKNTQFA